MCLQSVEFFTTICTDFKNDIHFRLAYRHNLPSFVENFVPLTSFRGKDDPKSSAWLTWWLGGRGSCDFC